MIGDDIEIVVTQVKGSYVKFGIKAPKDVKILRNELLGQPKKETR